MSDNNNNHNRGVRMGGRSSLRWTWMILMVSLVLNATLLIYLPASSFSGSSSSSSSFGGILDATSQVRKQSSSSSSLSKIDRSTASSSSSKVPSSASSMNTVLYGHINMFLTGGTNLNGQLASMFEGVCGSKGFSYDAYQYYHRIIRHRRRQKQHDDGKNNNNNNTSNNNDDDDDDDDDLLLLEGGPDLVTLHYDQSFPYKDYKKALRSQSIQQQLLLVATKEEDVTMKKATTKKLPKRFEKFLQQQQQQHKNDPTTTTTTSDPDDKQQQQQSKSQSQSQSMGMMMMMTTSKRSGVDDDGDATKDDGNDNDSITATSTKAITGQFDWSRWENNGRRRLQQQLRGGSSSSLLFRQERREQPPSSKGRRTLQQLQQRMMGNNKKKIQQLLLASGGGGGGGTLTDVASLDKKQLRAAIMQARQEQKQQEQGESLLASAQQDGLPDMNVLMQQQQQQQQLQMMMMGGGAGGRGRTNQIPSSVWNKLGGLYTNGIGGGGGGGGLDNFVGGIPSFIRDSNNQNDDDTVNGIDSTVMMNHHRYEYNRGWLPFNSDVMDEVGYESCDYISLEADWTKWIDLASSMAQSFQAKSSLISTLELHIPCPHDPVDHLLSSCHYHNVDWDCEKASSSPSFLEEQVQRCLANGILQRQFHEDLLMTLNEQSATTTRTNIKCFQALPDYEPYVQYMSHFLEQRRFKAPFVPRDNSDTIMMFPPTTNNSTTTTTTTTATDGNDKDDEPRMTLPRNTEEECIWNHPNLLKQVRSLLLLQRNEDNDNSSTAMMMMMMMIPSWYRFCDKCMGSEEELQLQLYYHNSNSKG